MFSRDLKYYRPTPRTIKEAFGPYHTSNFKSLSKRSSVENFVFIFGALLSFLIIVLAIWDIL